MTITFEAFKRLPVFGDLSGEVTDFAVCLAKRGLIQEQPGFFAASIMHELQTELAASFDTAEPERAAARLQTIFVEWYAGHFTPSRLQALEAEGLIAQSCGYTASLFVCVAQEIDDFFGLSVN